MQDIFLVYRGHELIAAYTNPEAAALHIASAAQLRVQKQVLYRSYQEQLNPNAPRCSCGKPVESGYTECSGCRAQAARKDAERKAAGLCVECGEPVAPGYTVCEEHRVKRAAALRRLIKYRRDNDLCLCCGGPRNAWFKNRRPKLSCSDCLEKRREASLARKGELLL